jgi:CSLREA domain-containing protein
MAATITVTTVADENGSGPNCSLREAIASANGDADVGGCVGVGVYGADTIVLGATLSLPATMTLTDPAGALTVTSDVTITGPGATQLAIDGNHTTRVFSISSGQVMMSDLTIQHGNSGRGAGIMNELGGTLTLTNSTLSGNSAFGHPPVPVSEGGGSRGLGGGIANTGTLTLHNCTLRDNSATDGWPGAGGGIYNDHIATLTNSTLSGNSAGEGGGIYNAGDASTLTLTNCTLTGNSASSGLGYGGGIAAYGSTTLSNTIVANSASGGDCAGAGINDDGHNLIEDATSSCGLTNGVNGNIVGVDPLLGPLANNGGPTQTIALLLGSQVINAGDSAVCTNPPVNGVDQRGYARPGSGHTQCSIGAYEADGFLAESCVGDCDGTRSATIDEIITLVNIALGNAGASACPHGVPSGADVDVALIIQAVNVALNGCVPDSACDDHNPCTVDHFSGGACQNTLPALPCTNGPAAAPMYVGVWTDDTAERRIFRDQDVDALRATWESQTAAGFRLIGVAGRQSSPGVVTFDSLFKASDDASYDLSVTADRAAFDEQVSSLGAQGKQLIHFETVTEGEGQWYVGVWLGAGNSALVMDLSLDQLRAERTARSAAGMRLIDIETYEVGGSRLYAGVFNEGNGPDDLQVGLTWDPFAAAFEQNGALHLVDVETWEENGQRLYAGAWNGANAGSERLVGGHDSAAFSAENASFEQKGKKLIDLDRFAGLPVPPAIFSAKIYEHLGTQVVGYSYALAKDGTVIGYGAQGYKRASWELVGAGLPMTPDTRIGIGSVSKPILATAFMTLGVSADDNFYPYFEQRFPNHGQGVDQVKIADLLTQKSGMTLRYSGGLSSCGSELGKSFDAWVEFLISKNLVGTPGVDWHYTNDNFCVVRALVETISGEDYVPYVNSHLFVPFGVFDATAYADPIDPALSYTVSGGALEQSPGFIWTQDWTPFVSGFGWHASAIDLIRFLNGLRTFAVLTPQRTDEMFNRGFGWYPVATAAGTAFYHPGLWGDPVTKRAAHTLVGHLPEGFDATVLINTYDSAYVHVVADPRPLPGPYPALDAAVDAFNFYWNEMQ